MGNTNPKLTTILPSEDAAGGEVHLASKIEKYNSDAFTQTLIAHFHAAKRKALDAISESDSEVTSATRISDHVDG